MNRNAITSAAVHGRVAKIDGMAADFAMWMKEVTLTALDRITREVKRRER